LSTTISQKHGQVKKLINKQELKKKIPPLKFYLKNLNLDSSSTLATKKGAGGGGHTNKK